jgi:hypothetical protein
MCFMLESQSVAVTNRLQPWCSVNEKNGVLNLMFLTEFREKHLGQRLCSRRIQPNVQQAVRCRIDGGVQPESLVVELDHGLINCNLIRFDAVGWL